MYPKFKGKPLLPTLSATQELCRFNITLDDVIEILERGYNCSPSKRKKGVIEKGMMVGKKEIRVVVADNIYDYHNGHQDDIWSLIHVGKKTYKKR